MFYDRGGKKRRRGSLITQTTKRGSREEECWDVRERRSGKKAANSRTSFPYSRISRKKKRIGNRIC